jgi:hypothetical protein
MLRLQVGNRQKDTLAKLQAFTNKLRTSTQKQQEKAAAAKAAQDAAAEQQRQQDEQGKQLEADAAAAANKPEAADGSSDKAPGADEAYDGKVGQCLCAAVVSGFWLNQRWQECRQQPAHCRSLDVWSPGPRMKLTDSCGAGVCVCVAHS